MPSFENRSVSNQELSEKCGVFGAITPGRDSSPTSLLGLVALQHRGQEACGIVSSNDGDQLAQHKDVGLVAQVFNGFDFSNLPGKISIGHTRYPTSSTSTKEKAHLQPVTSSENKFALAHNGNLPDLKALQDYFDQKGIPDHGYNDSEMMHADIEYQLNMGASIEEAVKESSTRFTGAWSLTMMTPDKLIAARDSKGIRPLSIGKLNGGYAFSSETVAFDLIDAQHIRDVFPGEMVVADGNSLRSIELFKGEQKLDVFEFIYFARPDSNLLDRNVSVVREEMGKRLAQEMRNEKKINADLVIGVPDSGTPGGFGFAIESGLPHTEALVKNRYSHRTFQLPRQEEREEAVNQKLNPISQKIYGKNLIVVDDSIVRGTTSKALVTMLRNKGAREVHLAITSPPVKYPDFYGINTPNQEELFSVRNSTIRQMCDEIGADSLHFLSIDGLVAATGLSPEQLSLSAFNGEYPVDIGKRKNEVRKV